MMNIPSSIVPYQHPANRKRSICGSLTIEMVSFAYESRGKATIKGCNGLPEASHRDKVAVIIFLQSELYQ
tara:strand:- start:4472 stop:4681 length:210 start_codon:yes stop_codon:yes gene_type:complete